MTATAFAFLFTGVVLNALAQLLLKAGTNAIGVIAFTRDNWLPLGTRMALEPHFIGGVACYGLSLVVWIIGLSRVPVSIAYPLLSLGYVLNAIGAHFLLGESLNAARIGGIGFIIVGVWLVARS
jgi:multidrug transporter EmrE-like cation transporter